jgi:hypothetical protein
MIILNLLSNVSTEWAILVFLMIAVSKIHRCFASSGPRLPPGPKPQPIVGNLGQIPSDSPAKVFAEWGKIYGPSHSQTDVIFLNWSWARSKGDVIYARVLGRPMVILNTVQAARDLLEKRSAIYSDRPRFLLLREMYAYLLSIFVFNVYLLPSAEYDYQGWAGTELQHFFHSMLIFFLAANYCPVDVLLLQRLEVAEASSLHTVAVQSKRFF